MLWERSWLGEGLLVLAGLPPSERLAKCFAHDVFLGLGRVENISSVKCREAEVVVGCKSSRELIANV